MQLSRRVARFNKLINNPIQGVYSWLVPPWAVILHRGRRSGRQYRTPLLAFRHDRTLVIALLYGAIDALEGFYRAPVEKSSRSVMNIVFRLPSEALEEKFVAEAKKAGMVGLKGHRSTGGIRVSAYNAVSVEDIKMLVSFMEAFSKANG